MVGIIRQHLPTYAVAAAILIGLAVVGVPISYVLLIGAFLVCALHTFFMIVDARHADTNKKNDDAPPWEDHETRIRH